MFYVTMAGMMAMEHQRAQILDGRPAAEAIKREVAEEVRELQRSGGASPTLAAVLVGEDPASAVYVRNNIRACEEVGIGSKHIALEADTSTDSLLKIVGDLNTDDSVDGILVQL